MHGGQGLVVEIRILGPIEVIGETDVVAIGGPRQRRLVAALALEHRNVVSDTQLIDVVWSDGDTPGDPRNALQTYVSRLRTAGLAVERSGAGYVLPADVGEIDAVAFEQEMTTAARLHERGDTDAAAVVAATALERWHGPSLAEFADEEWAWSEATRLDELRVQAREYLAELQIERGEPEIAELRSLCAEEPLRDGPHRLLMLALHSTGDQAAALRVFQDFRTRLAEETGLEPSSEIVGLERQIATGEVTALRPEVPSRLGSYEVGEMIGEGAFGSIYRATQPSVGREVAIKVVRPELANDPQFVRRFEVEAQTVARLEHPHIVPLYDYWRDPSGAYLVMRYLAGGSAEHRLVQQGAWTVEQVGQLVDEIGAALAVAHDAGVLHRDVKPANVLFDEQGNSYLADFGIAAEVGSVTVTDLRSAGSPLYVSPEQIRDGVASLSSDIYSFGVLLYELLVGQPPFADSDSVQALLERKVRERVPSISSDRPELPAGVDLVIQTATATDPLQRFPSMAELILAFRSATAGLPDVAGSTGGGQAAERPRGAAAQTLIGLEIEGVNPYKGLAAFDEADSDDFHGRQALADELVERLEASRFLVVTGPSGSGKSSVVRAGVLPRLRDSGAFVASIVPGTHPMDEVETALLRVATQPSGALLEQLTADERGLGRAVKTLLPDDGSELVLVVDQFEELFTITDEERRNEFLASLAAAVTGERSRLRVVCTLRADFYDRPLQHAAISELVRVNTAAVTPLTGEELDEAITRPAANVGVTAEPALVAELIAEAAGQAAALPMLQYALTEMFERQSGGRMTLEAYREIGGLTGALSNRADELFVELPPTGQAMARRLFTRLVTPGEGTEDTRRRVLRSELSGVSAEVIDTYGAARLLTFDHDPASREPTVEVAHEALLREWPRLRGWLDDDRDGLRVLRHLGQASEAWEASGREASELYRGGRLEAAEEWAAEHEDDLTPAEATFLRASVDRRAAEESAERRRVRRLRILLAATAVVAVVAGIAGVVALQQRSDARAQREVARDNEQAAEQSAGEARAAQAEAQTNETAAEGARFEAELERMAADAANLVEDDVTVALLLAAEASAMEQSPATLGALQNVLANTGPFLGWVGAGTHTTGAWWLDDQRLVGVGPDGVVIHDRGARTSVTLVSEPVAHRRLPRLDSQQNDFPVVAVSAEVGVAALVPEARSETVELWSIASGELVWSYDHPSQVDAVAIDGASGLAATLDFDGTLRIFEVASGLQRLEMDAHPEVLLTDQTFDDDVTPLSPSPLEATLIPGQVRFLDGGWVMTTRAFDTRVFEISSGELVVDTGFAAPARGLDLRAAWAAGLAVETVGTSVVWNSESQIAVHDLATGERSGGHKVPGTGLAAGTPKVVAVSVGSDHSDAYLVTNDGRVMSVVVETGEVRWTFQTRVNEPAGLMLSPDGRVLAVAGLEGIALVSTDGRQLLAKAGPRGQAEDPFLSGDGTRVTGASGDINWPMPYLDVEGDRLSPFDVDFLEPADQPFFTDGVPLLIRYARAAKVTMQDPVTLEPTVQFENSGNWSMHALDVDAGYYLIGENFFERHSLDLYDISSGELLASYPLRDDQVAFTGSFDPAGGRVLATFHSDPPVLLGLPELEPIQMPSDLGDLAGARWTSDRRWLATIDRRRHVTLRDPDTFEVVGTLEGSRLTDHLTNLTVYSMDDGRMLLSAVNSAPQLWDAESGRPVGGTFPTDAGLGFDGHDGLDMVVTGVGEHFLVWNLDTSTWRDIACEAAGRNMTLDEWNRWGPQGEDYRATCDQWPSLG